MKLIDMDIAKAAILAIENVATEGINDMLPRPFELDLLKNRDFKNKIFNIVVDSIKGYNLDKLSISPIKSILYPKKEIFDFRRTSLIEPLDVIKYLTIAIMLADAIETKKPKFDKKIIFSYRFKPSKGYIFRKSYNYTSFKNESARLGKQKNIK